jgi:hypothetical protein
MSEVMGELAIVRQHERARRVSVQAADRNDSHLVADDPDDGWPPVRVSSRRHDAGRLVQQDVDERLGREYGSVELDPVPPLDERREVSPLPVHGHPAGPDQVVRPAP